MRVDIDMGSQSGGKAAMLDLEELLATRLLVQGNSGSGKSHLLRRLLEQSAPWVQQCVIDPEGDFVTLADRFGHVVVDAARIRSFGPQRQLSVATAHQITANDEGSVFVLEGDAAIVRQAARGPGGEALPRMEFHGEYLRVSTDPEHIMSDKPVLLVRGKDQILASSMDYQGGARVVVLNGQVKAQFAPRP